MEVKATAKYLRISPRKARLVIDLIRGKSAREAEARTEAMLAGAREDIRNERENAMKQMQSEIGRLAMEAAAKIMESERSSDKDLALYDQFIKKAGDSDDDNSH